MDRAWNNLFLVLTFVLSCATASANEPKPAWNHIDEKTQFFREKGFTFEIENMPNHLYEKKTIELVVLIPDKFVHAGLTNSFVNVMLFNDELGVDVHTWSHEGKNRAIITISEAMAQKTELYFYFNNANGTTTEGTQFVLKISQIIQDLKPEISPDHQKDGK